MSPADRVVIGPWDILMWCKNVIFNFALLIGIFKSSYDNVLRWLPQDFTNDKSTLVQVMAWCRQATSHYLNQCWPRSPTPYDVTRPQWVKALACRLFGIKPLHIDPKCFYQENADENVICNISTSSSCLQGTVKNWFDYTADNMSRLPSVEYTHRNEQRASNGSSAPWGVKLRVIASLRMKGVWCLR